MDIPRLSLAGSWLVYQPEENKSSSCMMYVSVCVHMQGTIMSLTLSFRCRVSLSIDDY